MTPVLGGRSQLWVSFTRLGMRRSYANLYSRSNASKGRQEEGQDHYNPQNMQFLQFPSFTALTNMFHFSTDQITAHTHDEPTTIPRSSQERFGPLSLVLFPAATENVFAKKLQEVLFTQPVQCQMTDTVRD